MAHVMAHVMALRSSVDAGCRPQDLSGGIENDGFTSIVPSSRVNIDSFEDRFPSNVDILIASEASLLVSGRA